MKQFRPASPRRAGILIFWHISKSGGFGKVLIPSTRELFFLHKSHILSGEPLVGSPVTFAATPPAEGKVHPQATRAVIDNTRRVRALDAPNDHKATGRTTVLDVLSGKEGA